jgi:hypothetical protein
MRTAFSKSGALTSSFCGAAAAFFPRGIVVVSFGGGTGSGSLSSPRAMSFSINRASEMPIPACTQAVIIVAPAALDVRYWSSWMLIASRPSDQARRVDY